MRQALRGRSMRQWSAGLAGCVAALALLAGCGGTTTSTTTSTTSSSGVVSVVVTSPVSGTVINADSVTVRGTVTPPTATVQVQGQQAAVGNGIFTGTARLHSGKTTIDVIGSAPGASPGSTSVVITRQGSGGGSQGQTTSTQTNNGGTTSPPSSGAGQTSCGSGVSVGPNTSCAFALNVQSAYQSNGPGTIQVFSPVTNQTYSMTCSGFHPVVCTGANNATVYLP